MINHNQNHNQNLNQITTNSQPKSQPKSYLLPYLTAKTSLRHYKYSELVALYMDYLLDNVAPQEGAGLGSGPGNTGSNGGGGELAGPAVDAAAQECQRLIGGDAILWERWIYAFARRKLLRHLAASIPSNSPRLPQAVYEVVLESLLQSDTRMLCTIVDAWGSVQVMLTL